MKFGEWQTAKSRLARGCVTVTVAILSACGGGGGSQGEGPPAQVNNRLFAADAGSGVVGGFEQLVPTAGASFEGRQVGLTLSGVERLAIDAARDELYVLSDGLVSVYANATTASETAVPVRQIRLPRDAMTVNDMKLDIARDRLYVAVGRQYDDAVFVYDGAHTVQGATAPSRVFMPGNGARAIALDPDGKVMYATGFVTGIVRYEGVDAATGQVWGSGFLARQVSGYHLEFDAAHDRLYLADPFAGIRIVNEVSRLPFAVSATIAVPDITALALDLTTDRLYVAARTLAYVLSSASTLGAGSGLPAVAVQATTGSRISGFTFH